MKRNKSSLKLLAVLAAAAATAGAWAPAFGSSLTSIGVLDPTSGTTAYSTPYAVSQDGIYVAGESKNTDGLVYAVVWSATDGLVALPLPSGLDTRAIGVANGVGTNVGKIIVIGLHEGYLTQRYYEAPLGSLASGSWADCAAAGGLTVSDMRGGSYNDLRNAVPDGTGWPPLAAWYTNGKRASNGRNCRLRGNPFVAGQGGSPNTVSSVSSYAVSVGRSSDDPSFAYYDGGGASGTGWGFALTLVPGSTGFRADGFGISSSFGSATDFNKQWISGVIYNLNGGANGQAFRWMRGDASMTLLGTLPGDGQSISWTVADSGVTAGYSWHSGAETATVWDTSGTWDTTGTAKSIAALLNADGVDTSAWTSLNRVYAASDDGSVLAGFGTWAADGSTRGFVALKTVVRITNISVIGTTVKIDFTSNSTSDTVANFALQHCTVVNGTYADVSATITGSAESFEATPSTSGSAQFYRIRWHP